MIESAVPKQLDLQTRDGNLLLDRYEVEAQKFEQNLDISTKQSILKKAQAAKIARESSPSSGWGHLVDEYSGHGVLVD